MDYDHDSKAGNPGDVVKHALLVELLARLPGIDGRSVAYFETHAGAALHPLSPTGEWREGIGALSARQSGSGYARLVAAARPLGSDGRPAYPGSALLAAWALAERGARARLTVCDLDLGVCARLDATLGSLGLETTVVASDGMDRLASALATPAGRPDFVLVDPPSFDRALADAALAGCAAVGVPVLVWLPIVGAPGEIPPDVTALEASISTHLRAGWPRPGRADRCTRGCLCLGGGIDAPTWNGAVAAVRELPLPSTWELSARSATR